MLCESTRAAQPFPAGNDNFVGIAFESRVWVSLLDKDLSLSLSLLSLSLSLSLSLHLSIPPSLPPSLPPSPLLLLQYVIAN